MRMMQGGIGVSLWLRAEHCRSWLRRGGLGGGCGLLTAACHRVEGRHLRKRRTAISKNGLLSWIWLTWPAGSLNHGGTSLFPVFAWPVPHDGTPDVLAAFYPCALAPWAKFESNTEGPAFRPPNLPSCADMVTALEPSPRSQVQLVQLVHCMNAEDPQSQRQDLLCGYHQRNTSTG